MQPEVMQPEELCARASVRLHEFDYMIGEWGPAMPRITSGSRMPVKVMTLGHSYCTARSMPAFSFEIQNSKFSRLNGPFAKP